MHHTHAHFPPGFGAALRASTTDFSSALRSDAQEQAHAVRRECQT